MALPVHEPFEQLDDNVFLFPQKPHHREAVEIIADKRSLKKQDIFELGLIFCTHDNRRGSSDQMISIEGIAIENGCVAVSGDGGPVARISLGGVEFLKGKRARIVRRVASECQDAIS